MRSVPEPLTGWSILSLVASGAGLVTMGLANTARDAVPAWHWPMALFLGVMIILAARQMIADRRARRAVVKRADV